ncbi:D-arabinono-1,4-lactone oxidase [Agromyces neolithicus]|uniref:D-arabinono-1,4-lactone oxidase n=1 Tax=Agromyces neolithicus TaxID=269420 RepID=A0ABN2MCB2_9MICO
MISTSETETRASQQGWTNWFGNQQCAPAAIVRPKSESEVVHHLDNARRSGRSVRVAASGHSFGPICTTNGTLLELAEFSGISRVEPAARTATVLPGTRIADLGDPLWHAGLSLRNQGDIDAQQIAGAIATATHGSGLRLQNMSASLLGVRLATANGDILVIDEKTPDLLAAAQVSVGMLGVFTELTLSLRDAYQLRERVEHWTLDELRSQWRRGFENSHHFTFHYYPTANSHEFFDFDAPAGVDLTNLSRVTICDVVDLAEPEVLDHEPRIGRPYRLYPQYCAPNFHELEYMVDFEDGLDAFEAVLDVVERFPEFGIYPVEVRSTAADEAYLSPNHGRRSLVISVSGEPGKPYEPYLQAVHDTLLRFSA